MHAKLLQYICTLLIQYVQYFSNPLHVQLCFSNKYIFPVQNVCARQYVLQYECSMHMHYICCVHIWQEYEIFTTYIPNICKTSTDMHYVLLTFAFKLQSGYVHILGKMCANLCAILHPNTVEFNTALNVTVSELVSQWCIFEQHLVSWNNRLLIKHTVELWHQVFYLWCNTHFQALW